MDINSLLSPQDTPRSGPSTPASSPRKGVKRVASGSLKRNVPSSPLTLSSIPPASSLPPHVLTPTGRAPTSSPSLSPGSRFPRTTPPPGEVQRQRQSSTPSMDTLADLASMQNHQPSRTAPPVIRNKSYESQLSPSTIFPTVQPVAPTSTPRSSFDIAMTDAGKDPPRKDFTGTSLGLQEQQSANGLSTKLLQSPYDFDSHVALIKILHQGFINHVYPPSAPDSHGDPHAYDLLKDLRAARENMDKIYALGHDLWAKWIQDESMMAHNVDERVSVMEKCKKAVDEEYGCTILWPTYGDWVLHCYNFYKDSVEQNDTGNLSEAELMDKMVGKEVFTWESVLDVWREGAEETKWRMNDSHLIWDRYLELVVEDLARAITPQRVADVKALFDLRLQIPHGHWDETFQIFSTFISTYLNSEYEDTMVTTTRMAAGAKAIWGAREMFELKLARAYESQDTAAEYTGFAEYIEWERTPEKRRPVNFDLVVALYQRANLRFPSDPNIWGDLVVFMLDQAYSQNLRVSTLPVLERATRHCPWSGSLWSQYLLSSEREGQLYSQTEEIKHKCTQTGLLDGGGMDEVLKVHTAWCSYLRRRAFQADSTDEDSDVAEMGIRSSIETLQELGTKKYGQAYQGDPMFRLERIYIKYLSESGSWDSAREVFKGLIPKLGDNHNFWLRWYIWELLCWGKFIQGEKFKKTPTPYSATAVLRQALHRPSLDWPERIIASYTSHCEDHADVEELQQAMLEIRKVEKLVALRRLREAEETAVQQAEQSAEQPEATESGINTGKRKRDDDTVEDVEPSKKSRSDDAEMPPPEQPLTAEKAIKRDRENATIVIRNLPPQVSEIRVRQFFRDCGIINSLKVLRDSADEASAVVEFDEKEAALAAQTKDGRDLDDYTVDIQLGSGSTIFVANFAATADEDSIRTLFSKYGDIVDIRFPSLKYNTHRRFCYVQFKLNAMAQAATIMDGKIVGEGQKLVAKISNPLQKEDRSGPLEEGREVYVRNINWSATEDNVRSLFSRFGSLESVRIPRKAGGGSKGIAFLVFSSQDEATAAVELNNTEFMSRQIHVEKSVKGGAKKQAITRINQSSSRSQSPSVSVDANGIVRSPGTNPDSQQHTYQETDTGAAWERAFGLWNIPDTVNDSRIRSIAEPYGSLVKIVLRPDHGGAIVEYVNKQDAGKAELGLGGFEITPGQKMEAGRVKELLKQAPHKKADKIQIGKQKFAAEKRPSMLNPGPIRRPAQQAGKRGGLGQKRGAAFHGHNGGGGATSNEHDVKMENGEEPAKAKSNNDFRAMLAKK